MTRIKICGITSEQDAEAAVAFGADAIGLVFYPPSPRHIADLQLARRIAETAGPFVNVVGLMVNPSREDLDAILGAVPVTTLQFHGDESPEFCELAGRPYIKALRMKDDLVDDALNDLIDSYDRASGILLDTYKKGIPGGTGEAFNWDRFPKLASKPVVLAGGLTPENVGSAVRATKPYAVDVSGGVEASPGKKDHKKIREFIEQAKVI